MSLERTIRGVLQERLTPEAKKLQEETLPGKGKDTWMKDGVEMCPEECCGQPVTECKCGTDCKICNCAERKAMVDEELDEKTLTPDADLKLPNGKDIVLQADDDEYTRGLVIRSNADGSYDSYYWYNDPKKKYPIEVQVDGKSVSKDAKNVHWKYHPELKENFAEATAQAKKENAGIEAMKKAGNAKADAEAKERVKKTAEAYNEPQGQAKSMMSPLHKARMDKEKADRDRDGKLKPGIVKVKKEETGIEEAKKVSSMQIHKVLAPTKNSREGIAALKKAFRVNDREAQMMLKKVMNEETIDEISRTMTPMRKKFGGTVDPKKFDMYKKHIKQHKVDEPTVRMVIDNPDDAESKRMMKNKHVAQAVSLRKAAMKESIEEAKKPDETINIRQSLKKAIDMRGQKDVVFKDGSKAKISVQDAEKAMKMLDNTRMAKAKQDLTVRMMKSHQDFKDTLAGKKPKVDPFALRVKKNEETVNEKFANPAQQAAVMAKLKSDGKYKNEDNNPKIVRHLELAKKARAEGDYDKANKHTQMARSLQNEGTFVSKFKEELKAKKRGMSETKGAPKGYHFTRSGQLKKGDAGQDGDGGKMLRSDPLDKQRKKIPPLPENDK